MIMLHFYTQFEYFSKNVKTIFSSTIFRDYKITMAKAIKEPWKLFF